MAKITRAEAEAMGFTVDTTCYPWFAYKGARFAPEMKHHCLTDAEAMLAVALAQRLDDEDSGCGNYDSFAHRAILAHTGRSIGDLAKLANAMEAGK